MENRTGFSNDTMLQQSEFNRFGVISMLILVIGCLGGIAVGLGGINHIFSLILIIIPTMTTLSFLLAVAPMKWILTAAVLTVFIDVCMILFYTLIA